MVMCLSYPPPEPRLIFPAPLYRQARRQGLVESADAKKPAAKTNRLFPLGKMRACYAVPYARL